jgi:hypothetical protein
MKFFTLTISFLFITISLSYAQNTVQDTHPGSDIFAIDYSTGQETLVNFDAAVLFKDALIDLVSNTTAARMHLSRMVPGRKNFVITQMDPQTSGNAYQLVLQAKAFNQTNIIYTFMYNVDQNTLSFFDAQSQTYMPVPIQGPNLNNLSNCSVYGKFNLQNAQAAVDPAAQAVDPATEAPVDVNVTATTTPPPMPEYEQPPCPADGYLWQPGYWAFSPGGGYYWVPGAWVAPPSTGLLWTPPYWAFVNGIYAFNAGYWGNNVGYYGGVYYGYGYGGEGFYGGNWHEGRFRYNTAVVRVNTVVIHNTYVDRTVVVENHQANRASFNGRGGVIATPTARDVAATHEHHVMATPEQNRNQQLARADKSQFVSANGGKPVNLAREKAPARSELINPALKAGVAGAGAGKPGTPGSAVSRPVSAGAPGAKPGLAGSPGAAPTGPAGPGAKPGVAGAPGAAPAGPGAKPGIPGAVGTKPVGPGGPGTRADVPAVPGAKPGIPGAVGTKPVGPGGPGIRADVPAVPGAKPGVPGAPSAKPAIPGATPAVPGAPGARPNAPSGPGVKPGPPGLPGAKPGVGGTRSAPVRTPPPPKNEPKQKDPAPKKS